MVLSLDDAWEKTEQWPGDENGFRFLWAQRGPTLEEFIEKPYQNRISLLRAEAENRGRPVP